MQYPHLEDFSKRTCASFSSTNASYQLPVCFTKSSKTACNKLNEGMASSSLDAFSRWTVLLREQIMNLRSAACGTSTSSLSGLVFRHSVIIWETHGNRTQSRQTISIQSWAKTPACNASLKESHFRVSHTLPILPRGAASDRTYKSDSQCVAEQVKSETKCYPDVSNVMDRRGDKSC